MNRTHALIASSIALSGLAAGLAGFGPRSVPVEMTAASGIAMVETATSSAVETYAVDPVHTNVIFKIRHGAVSNFYGRFNEVEGSIEFDKDHVEKTSMSFTIPVSSVDTNSKMRDGHIKDAEFFNARQFKDITFASSSLTDNGSGSYTLKGNLTLHGVTKEIEATLDQIGTGSSRNGPTMGFEARFTIKRSDYGIMKYLADDLSDEGPLGNTVELIVAIEAGVE